MTRFLYWAPRALAIVFAACVGLFALDVFGTGQSAWQTIAALLIHLIPVYVIVAVLIVAWRHEWAGAILFPALALAYPIAVGAGAHWSVYSVMMGPPLLIGALFLASWQRKRQPATA